jgi:serine protease
MPTPPRAHLNLRAARGQRGSALLPLLPLFWAALTLAPVARAAGAAAPSAPFAPAPSFSRAAPLPPVEGEVIVRFRADAAPLRQHALPAGVRGEALLRALAGRAQALGSRAGRVLVAGAAVGERTQVVRAAGIDAAELARRLAADPAVEFAVPNGRKRRLAVPDDPLYPPSATDLRPNGLGQQSGPASGQWYLRPPDDTLRSAIDVEAAWSRLGSRGRPEVVVAVLDTGLRFDHPDLRRIAAGGRMLDGYDFVSTLAVANDGDGRDADPSDPGDWVTLAESRTSTFSGCDPSGSSWHGTSTASLVGATADNAIGMTGAAPGLRVLPVRVLGKCYGTDADIQAAMRWAAGIPVAGVPDNPSPARVINMSLGSSDPCSASYQAVVDEIVARGVMIVAAAGNSAGGPVGSPASCRGVVAVGGLRHAGTKVGFSDLGPEIAISAPAGNCINIATGTPCLYPVLAATDAGSQGPTESRWSDSYAITVGTSFASPLVAATVGLVWSMQPALGVGQVRSVLQASARPFPSSGADNGPDDTTPVLACQPPQAGVDQLQCYCNTSLCGAGMLDAGAAVRAAAGSTLAGITVSPPSPLAGQVLTFDAGASLAAPGATIVSYAWALLDGGGIASGFSSATNASAATLTPTGAGTLRVQLTIVDSLGATARAEELVTVAAGSGPTPPAEPPASSDGGGGGGLAPGWLLGLATALAALRRRGGLSDAARRA